MWNLFLHTSHKRGLWKQWGWLWLVLLAYSKALSHFLHSLYKVHEMNAYRGGQCLPNHSVHLQNYWTYFNGQLGLTQTCPANFNFGLYWCTITPTSHEAQIKCYQFLLHLLFIQVMKCTVQCNNPGTLPEFDPWPLQIASVTYHSCLASIAFAWEGCLMSVFLGYDIITENSPKWLCGWLGIPISNQESLGIPYPATSTCRNSCRPSCKVPIFVVWSEPKL
jgi:hypothetical protein